MSGTRGPAPWLRFEIGGERFALPIEAVAEIVGLTHLKAAGVAGWVGLLTLRNGTLPIADGTSLLGGGRDGSVQGRALVLRGRFPLGMSVDSVLGLGSGAACPLVARVGLPDLTMAAIPAADGPTLVLDPDRLWRRIWTSLEALPGESGFRLLPIGGSGGERESEQRVLVFRLGADLRLAVPIEQVLEVGPERAARPIPGGPGHLAGMLDWHGRLVPVVDLSARLGLSFDGPRQTLYLALTGRAARALAVQIGEVVGEAQLTAGPGDQAELGPRPGWIVGVASIGERRLAIVDAAALLVA